MFQYIIFLGFPRTGTTSFHTMFQSLGWTSYHWKYRENYVGEMMYRCKFKNQRLLAFVDLERRHPVCLTQMDVCLSKDLNFWPQVNDYQQLWRENPHALFILNTRNVNDLLRSWHAWNHLDQRILQYNPELFFGLQSLAPTLRLLTFFARHYARITEFFRDKRNFLIYDLDKDNLSKLRPYLTLPAPPYSLPYLNQTKQKPTTKDPQKKSVCASRKKF